MQSAPLPSVRQRDLAASERAAGLWPRRAVLGFLGAAGAGAVFSRAFVAVAAERPVATSEMLRRAEWISGLELDDAKRELMLDGINELLGQFEQLRAVSLDNGVPPAIAFDPTVFAAPFETATVDEPARPTEWATAGRPASEFDLAFLPVSELAALLRSREVSAVELMRLSLERLERFDPQLRCVITRTEDLALEAAERADREIAAGIYRGPLHGVPWGAKDLLAVPPYRTTWGAGPYSDQVLVERATIVAKLADAGAVLVAKLALGALAWGDEWFDGKTLNPWNLEQGSSGSSAGSAAATAAGLVAFAIGSETWGSIVSPCTRCGVTGLRPTFGRVSRYGAMALSWSMDKLGPIARSVEDCALVFDAIRGRDGRDPSSVDRPFAWPPRRDPRSLRIGVVEEAFAHDRAAEADDDAGRAALAEWQRFDRRTLEVLERNGFDLVPIRLPKRYPIEPLSLILTAEAATAFDDLTRSGRDAGLRRQVEQAWPNVFRQGQMIPAVEYLRANRVRHEVMRELEESLGDVDAWVCPSFVGDNLLMTNLTGHPAVVLPNGFRSADGTPTSITFNGRLFGESDLLAVAHAYQQTTDFHLRRPPVGGAPHEA